MLFYSCVFLGTQVMQDTQNLTDNEYIIDGIIIKFTEIFSNNGCNVADIIENNIMREVKHTVSQ